jgi:FAD/FMN-containing dehydrogenase
MQTTIAPARVDLLRRTIDGEVITPADPGYDEARRLWNALHDRRPAVIARPTTAQEVATAIAFGREHDLELQVRAGGHSARGLAGADGGLLVDLSSMRGVTVDPGRRFAWANGGALLGELDVAAQAYGLVCPTGVIGHTGVAGLTLGGGVGRLQRRFGLTIDNLLAVELVTADGRLVRASEAEEPELFWGMRGAGWNFGIATAFEFRLHEFGPDLHRGVLTFRGTRVHEIWDVFREYMAQAPDEISCIFGIASAGAGEDYPGDVEGRPIVYVAWNHAGPTAADAERDTAPLLAVPGRLTTMIASQPYLEVQAAHDLKLGWGTRSHIRSRNGNGVRAEALDEVVELVGQAPADSSFSITALGGAIGRVPEDATAYPGREARFDMSADTNWADAADDEANVEWCRLVVAAVEGDAAIGGYANGNGDTGPEETRRIFGDAKLARLRQLKRAWDPDNVFHVNHNVAP